jgi:glyoxylase I family protein
MIKADGIAHVTLTVSDVLATKQFYEDLFETEFPMDDDKSFSLKKVGIPCWFVQWKTKTSDKFDEKKVGLDHIAFKLQTLEALNEVVSKLKTMNVETAGLQRFSGKYPYVAFRDPDNIQTEFFIPKEL